jgi:hypothetical protein
LVAGDLLARPTGAQRGRQSALLLFVLSGDEISHDNGCRSHREAGAASCFSARSRTLVA